MIALQILAEAAKSSQMAMRALHNLARGFRPVDSMTTSPEQSRTQSSGMYCSELVTVYITNAELHCKSKTFQTANKNKTSYFQLTEMANRNMTRII